MSMGAREGFDRTDSMSFRASLSFFFLVIVVLPAIALVVLIAQISEDSREGKADARLATTLHAAQRIYDEARGEAPARVRELAADPAVASALERRDRGRLAELARRALRRPGVASVTFLAPAGEILARAGPRDGIAFSENPIVPEGGEPVGRIRIAMLSAGPYVERVERLTGQPAAVQTDRGTLAATIPLGDASLSNRPDSENVELPEDSMRAAGLRLDGAPAGAALVALTPLAESVLTSEPALLLVMAGFVLLAVLCVLFVLRTLGRQVETMLAAASRIGEGDFSQTVPVHGNDELAGLAREFNKMSERLSAQMSELRHQREELERSVRRIGEAFASGLDRAALLEIVVETAVAACDAESGRIEPATDGRRVVAGAPAEGRIGEALDRALAEARRTRRPGEIELAGVHAIAQPLSPAGGAAEPATMGVARRRRPFSSDEREVLGYLIGQASVSVENIGLHELVAEQAVTDELTGLANNRHFREWMARESERLGRFGGEISLVLLDIDDFKEVNDNRGHLQGDRVLAAIGRVLQLESRGIDEAARYGGEEFVLALPETSGPGAAEVAERVRHRIEELAIETGDGGEPLRVTASLGVATMPGDGETVEELVAAADAALYRAKAGGKNRVEVAAGAIGR
jgi:diguanylate cyclase (GGDEF)-like protein